MAHLLARALFFLLALPLVASAAALDDYYLSKFARTVDLNKALMTVAGLESPPLERCRTHLYRSLKRDFKALQPATQKVLAKYISRPILSGQNSEYSAPSYHLPEGHFNIHYTATGSDAPDLTSNDGDQVPDWVQRVAEVFEEVYSREVVAFGYRPPPFLVRYDVYLRDLASESAYGYTSDDGIPAYPEVSTASFIEIDKDFSAPLLTENGKYNPNQLLQITAAHEFHHAIQFGYNYYFDIWYGEVTSTWMEDQVYDEVNQLYSYLPKYIPLAGTISLDGPLGGNSEYGRWIFNRYLAQRHGVGAVRTVWEKLATLSPTTSPTTGTGDIQMAPVIASVLATSYGSTLGGDFLGFAKRIYARDWTTHTTEIGLIPQHKVTASYYAYPVTSASTPAPSVTLPRYSFVFYRFVPSPDLENLTLNVNKASGLKTALFVKSRGVVRELAASPDGTAYFVPGFNLLDPTNDEVVLLIANTSSVNASASFTTDNIVNGLCGRANNTVFAQAPQFDLCAFGAATVVTGPGPWTWYCAGTNGGTTAECSAAAIEDPIISDGNGVITATPLSLTDSELSPTTKPTQFVPTAAYELAIRSSEFKQNVSFPVTGVPMSPVIYTIAGSRWIKLAPDDLVVSADALVLKVTDNGALDTNPQQGEITCVIVIGYDLPTPPDSNPTNAQGGGGGGGCFIATAAYGSYLHPKVAELREFRDHYLLTNAPGRLFVSLYYRLSPPFAELIGEHEWMRRGVRVLLVPVLQAVEHPVGALLVLLVGVGGMASRRVRRSLVPKLQLGNPGRH